MADVFGSATGPAGTDSGGTALTECCENCLYYRASGDHEFMYYDEDGNAIQDDDGNDLVITVEGWTDQGVCRYEPPHYGGYHSSVNHIEARLNVHKYDWCGQWVTAT